MKSIFAKIVIWSCCTLVVSLVALFLITGWVARRADRRGGMILRLQSFELEEARKAYESGGSAGAAAFLARLNSADQHHYLVDARGRDLIDGRDRSGELALGKRSGNAPVSSPEGMITATISPDARYAIIVTASPPFEAWQFLPYFALILFVVGLLSWPLALHIGKPISTLAHAVDRFGQGDRSIRLGLTRRDEIGNLGSSFDRMADRIDSLLTAERQLLQDVSHELRSPLARLSFAVELARTAPDRDFAFLKVRKELGRLNQLVGALLEMTRHEGDPASKTGPHFSLLAVDELVREVVDDCRIENAGRTCTISLIRADSVSIMGDRELMRRAIENVLRNAIYYSPSGSTVEVSVAASGQQAQIAVRDSGPGVPEEMLPKIFQPFFRVDTSRNAATGGLGLGLSISSRAVRLHGGEIRAKNAAPGLLVEISVPAVSSDTSPADTPFAEEHSSEVDASLFEL
jgi:two-component system sensor histidine kinase CpxA